MSSTSFVLLQTTYLILCLGLWWLGTFHEQRPYKRFTQRNIIPAKWPWLTNKKDTKPNILEHLDINLSRSQYIATSIINYDSYINNMFALEKFSHNFMKQLVNVINSKPPERLNRDKPIFKYNQIPLYSYSDTVILIDQITPKNVTMPGTISLTTLTWPMMPWPNKRKEFSWPSLTSYLAQLKAKICKKQKEHFHFNAKSKSLTIFYWS